MSGLPICKNCTYSSESSGEYVCTHEDSKDLIDGHIMTCIQQRFPIDSDKYPAMYCGRSGRWFIEKDKTMSMQLMALIKEQNQETSGC